MGQERLFDTTANPRRASGLSRQVGFLCIVGFCVTPALVSRGVASDTTSRTFRAGAAASNITPPLDEGIVGGWGTPPATHIHDELYARSLVLDDGSTKLVLVLVDSVGVAREVFDAAKESICQKTGIPVENMLMADRKSVV